MKKRPAHKGGRIVTAIVFLIMLGYGILRYNVIKGVPYANLPLFVGNKGFAVASATLIGLAYLIGPLSRFWPKTFVKHLYLRKYLGLSGFALAVVHTVMSLLLFSPANYSKFFTETGALNLTGELSMLFGVLALAIFSIVTVSSLKPVMEELGEKKWLQVQRTGYLAYFFVLIHVFFMGIKGWLQPDHWPGGLIPMSMLAGIIIALVLLVRAFVIFLPKKARVKHK